VRYVSDSSYWLYLVHVPLIIAGQALLRGLDLPAVVKFTLLIAVATAILLVSYRFLVRYTWIGRLLNGPRPLADRQQQEGRVGWRVNDKECGIVAGSGGLDDGRRPQQLASRNPRRLSHSASRGT
jgi:hypothetical protein